MLIAPRVLSKIDQIVDQAYLVFAMSVIGLEALSEEEQFRLQSLGTLAVRRPLIELLYLLARKREHPLTFKEQSLAEAFMNLNEAQLPIINDESQYTIDHAKIQAKQALDVTRNEVKNRVKQEILTANTKLKEARALQEGVDKEAALSGLLEKVGALVVGGVIAKVFLKEFVTSVTNTINSSVVDELRMRALFQGKNPADILVFKQVVWDNRLSPECRRLHANPDGSPKIYTLRELEANGTNIGKPKSQWKAVIGGTHPNCRCQIKQAIDVNKKVNSSAPEKVDSLKKSVVINNFSLAKSKNSIKGVFGRDAFLYLDPKGNKKKFAQCETCMMFTGSSCTIHGPSVKITKGMSCSLYVHGKPMPEEKGHEMKLVTPEESGLVERQVRCHNCKFYRDEDSVCRLFEKLDIKDKKVDSHGCCNAQTSKDPSEED